MLLQVLFCMAPLRTVLLGNGRVCFAMCVRDSNQPPSSKKLWSAQQQNNLIAYHTQTAPSFCTVFWVSLSQGVSLAVRVL